MQNFTHLHVHSEYSLLDGACKIKELIKRAKELGQSAIAVTDHGVMYGAIDFYKEAKQQGIKPIIGCEVYVSARSRFDKIKEFDSEIHHLVLLCKNAEGYKNLIKMVSCGFIEGFYNKPRIDLDLLQKHHDDLIALSACLAGEIPRLLLKNRYEDAKNKALQYQQIFKDGNYYLELQDHGISEQKYVNPLLQKISKETGIPLVATNDCHYINKSDSKMHEVLLCIQTGHTINDETKMEFFGSEFYLKSGDEMQSLFAQYQESLENTNLIAQKCNLDFTFGETKLPHFEVPDGKNHFEYFKELCYKGLHRNYGKGPNNSLINRLDYELTVINKMGYIDYFLIVHDFIDYARSIGIPVGPGRGSGAGSLAAYCIGITGLDPIKYNLLFERFLNPERVSMPDFDIDFCYVRRQEVIDYVIKKYGADHVAQIITFGTMAAKGSIRDVGRAMGISYQTVNTVAKLIPAELNMTIARAVNSSKDLKHIYDTDAQIHSLIDMSIKVEGMPRHASTHAAGVVITRDPVVSYVPLSRHDESVITQYTMTTLEELGLLKMDFLGLRTLTVISDAEKAIKRFEPGFEINNIDETDSQVYKMLANGNTEGIFQFESTGMTNVLTQLSPVCIEDITAVISLYRPGPMNTIPKYIENRHKPESIKYADDKLKGILNVTYGCIIYQEQVMQIFRSLAGYSLGRADIVRRAMSKKKADVMEKERQIFIYGLKDDKGNIEVPGCIRMGINEQVAKDIFCEMESFASYAFNKSHAASYAVISYQTAWLKCKYPHEYMAALLTSVLDNPNKISRYIAECARMKIEVLSPHVNESDINFATSGKSIRFALLAVKNLGRNLINSLLQERKNNGKFQSFYDFCKRLHGKELNKRALESLIYCGALDDLGANRRQMLIVSEEIINNLDNDKKKNIEGQIGFFDLSPHQEGNTEIIIPVADEFPISHILSMEKEITGIYISGHPLAQYSKEIETGNYNKISDLINIDGYSNKYKDGDYVNILAIINKVQTKATKNNATMAFVMIEDMSGCIEMLVFPKVWEDCARVMRDGNIIKVTAKLSIREDEEPKLICERAVDIHDTLKPQNLPVLPIKSQNPGLYVKIPSKDSIEYKKLCLLLNIFAGKTPVYLFLQDSKKLLIAPTNMWVSLNDVLLTELKCSFGFENIAVKA